MIKIGSKKEDSHFKLAFYNKPICSSVYSPCCVGLNITNGDECGGLPEEMIENNEYHLNIKILTKIFNPEWRFMIIICLGEKIIMRENVEPKQCLLKKRDQNFYIDMFKCDKKITIPKLTDDETNFKIILYKIELSDQIMLFNFASKQFKIEY